MATKRKDAPDDPMLKMRKEYDTDRSACADKYQQCIDDIEFGFVPGKMWDADMKAKRGLRPCYEFNRTAPLVKAISNDMRQNDPAIKVRAEQDSRKVEAEIYNGLIKNIEAQSRANTAYDTAGFFAASGGFGVIGLDTEYSDDEIFEQDARILEKRNPFAITFDCAAKKLDKRDGRRAWEETEIPREEFDSLYPDKDPCDFNSANLARNYFKGWATEKTVRIVKLWRRVPGTKTIYQLSDGRVLDQDDYDALLPTLNQPPPSDPQTGQPQGESLTLKNQRVVRSHKITWEICSGKEVLEGPNDWAGKFIPLIPVWGESVNIEGEEFYQGLTRRLKDSQRLHNWTVCTGMETIANQPRSPFILTAKMVEGYEKAWQGLAIDNAPAIFYNHDPNAPQGPRRENPPLFPAGFFETAQFSADEMKSLANVVDAPIQSRASSGKAIQAVENQQAVGNFDYIDNLARGKAFLGEQLVDLIPKIYDTEREVMILGEDGKESYKTLNQSVYKTRDGQTLMQEQLDQMQAHGMPIPSGQWQVINDLSQGKFAITVTVGPSYATQRMETVEVLSQLGQNPDPGLSALAFYGVIKNTDAPGLSELEKAARKMLIARGLIEPGESDQAPPAQGPSPDDQLKTAQAHKAMADAAKTVQETRKGPEVVDTSLDWGKLQIARYDAITKRMALGLDVSQAERQFMLDHATALHDATMQVAQHEQAPVMQAMDQQHQQQTQQMDQAHQLGMVQFAAANPPPQTNGQ